MVGYRTNDNNILQDCEYLIETLDSIKQEIIDACETQKSEIIFKTLIEYRDTNRLIDLFLSKIISGKE